MRKDDVKDLDTLEVYYDKIRKIKFDDNVKIESLDDIYNNLFTIKRDGKYSQQPTFFIRGGFQCSAGRYRSIDDFIKLVKKYFPEKTLKEIFQFLKQREETYKKEELIQSFRYCSHIRKYNYSGLIPMRYSSKIGIESYKLKDLNRNLEGLTVAELLT